MLVHFTSTAPHVRLSVAYIPNGWRECPISLDIESEGCGRSSLNMSVDAADQLGHQLLAAVREARESAVPVGDPRSPANGDDCLDLDTPIPYDLGGEAGSA